MARKVIWKYRLGTSVENIKMPRDAKILSVEVQYDSIAIWAIVDPEEILVVRNFLVIGTGHFLEEELFDFPFIGTVLLGTFVFHIFDEGEVQ